MPERPVTPPWRKPVQELNSPNHRLGFYTELVNREDSAYQEVWPIKRGTPYAAIKGSDSRVISDYSTNPLYFLKQIRPGSSSSSDYGSSDQAVLWIWATDALAEDTYNADIDYPGEDKTVSRYARTSDVRRKDYEANPTVNYGSLLTGLMSIAITAAGTGYTYATGTIATGATAEAVCFGGAIIDWIVTNQGTGVASGGVITIAGDGTGATATARIQPAAAILTHQEKKELSEDNPRNHDYVQVIRVYEILPGPWLYDTRDDLLLGPVQRQRRAILASTIPSPLPLPTATTKTTYEARDGSSFVSWEIVETFSNGTGGGNPAFPILPSRPYEDKVRGSITRTEQLVIAAGQVGGPPTESGGVVTRITYEQVDEFHMRKVTETWILANTPTLTTQRYDDPSDTFVITSRRLKLTSAITEGITLVNATDDTITLIESDGYDVIGAFEVSTTWTEPVARDSSTQIITSQNAGPKQFPFVIYDPDLWIISNGLLGSTPKFTTTDNTFTTKTFWTFSATEPDLTLDGILRPATIDSFLGFLGISPAGDVLVDGGADYFVGGVTITISASTPSATVYLSDYVGGSPRSVDGQVKMDTNRYRWRTDRQFMQFIIQARPVYT